MKRYKFVKYEILPKYLMLDDTELEDCAIFVKNHWWSKWKPYEPTGAIPPFKMHTEKEAMQIVNVRNYCEI